MHPTQKPTGHFASLNPSHGTPNPTSAPHPTSAPPGILDTTISHTETASQALSTKKPKFTSGRSRTVNKPHFKSSGKGAVVSRKPDAPTAPTAPTGPTGPTAPTGSTNKSLTLDMFKKEAESHDKRLNSLSTSEKIFSFAKDAGLVVVAAAASVVMPVMAPIFILGAVFGIIARHSSAQTEYKQQLWSKFDQAKLIEHVKQHGGGGETPLRFIMACESGNINEQIKILRKIEIDTKTKMDLNEFLQTTSNPMAAFPGAGGHTPGTLTTVPPPPNSTALSPVMRDVFDAKQAFQQNPQTGFPKFRDALRKLEKENETNYSNNGKSTSYSALETLKMSLMAEAELIKSLARETIEDLFSERLEIVNKQILALGDRLREEIDLR